MSDTTRLTMNVARAAAQDGRAPEPAYGHLPGQADRLTAALADELRNLYRIVWYVADPEDPGEDELVQQLSMLSRTTVEEVLPGQERSWLLQTLLRLVSADVHGPDAPLPALPVRGAAQRGEISDADFQKLHDALQELDKPERATVVLVVQEGVTLDQGSRIQGGSRSDFARRYIEAMNVLEDEHVTSLAVS